MSKELKAQDAKSRIIRYLTKSDITLTAEEETMLARWEHIDLLTRQGTDYPTILEKHTAKFNISKHTTNNDISHAQEAFGRSRQLNRRYLAHLHIEDLQQDLKLIRKQYFKIDPKTGQFETFPDAKEVAALAKLHDALTKARNTLPDDMHVPDVPKPVIKYVLVGVNVPQLMQITDALRLADSFIDGLPVIETIPEDDGDE